MHSIAIAVQKGGVGKTSLTINLAGALVEAGCRVLVIDADPQGNATWGLGLGENEFRTQLYDVLMDAAVPVSDAIYETEIEGLYILPADIDLSAAEVQLPGQSEPWDQSIERVIRSIPRDFRIDYCLVDTAPSLGILTRAALTATDFYLVPLDVSDLQAIKGIRHLIDVTTTIQQYRNPSLTELGIVIVRPNLTMRATHENLKSSREFYQDRLFETVIHRDAQITYAYEAATPVVYYNPSARGARDYRQLAQEVLNRVKQRKTSK